MLYGATADAGVGIMGGLLTFHVAQGGKGETRICSQPKSGTYRKAVAINSMNEVVSALQSADFKVSDFGILAHGDKGGTIVLGNDTLDVWSIDTFKNQFRDINSSLSDGGTLFIYGCVSGAGRDGTVLLKEISKMLPKKKVVGFNVIVIVKPSEARTEGGNIFGMGARPCYDPDMWATKAKAQSEMTARAMWEGSVPATPDAPAAKVAMDGAITKWPADEDQQKNDAIKEPLKLDSEIMMKLVKEWESHMASEGRYTREQMELYKWNKEMVDRFNAWLKQKGVKKSLPAPK